MTDHPPTPGWQDNDSDYLHNSDQWTAEQHMQVACRLLDGVYSPSVSEGAFDGRPAWRSYADDEDDDHRLGDPPSYGNTYKAAMIHIQIARFKQAYEISEYQARAIQEGGIK